MKILHGLIFGLCLLPFTVHAAEEDYTWKKFTDDLNAFNAEMDKFDAQDRARESSTSYETPQPWGSSIEKPRFYDEPTAARDDRLHSINPRTDNQMYNEWENRPAGGSLSGIQMHQLEPASGR